MRATLQLMEFERRRSWRSGKMLKGESSMWKTMLEMMQRLEQTLRTKNFQSRQTRWPLQRCWKMKLQ